MLWPANIFEIRYFIVHIIPNVFGQGIVNLDVARNQLLLAGGWFEVDIVVGSGT